MTTSTPFEDLLPAFPRIDREWEARKPRLMAMTATQRVAAMRAGDLTYRELAHWSAARPDEVPRLSTGSGAGGGEFEWIAAFTPEIAEATPRRRRDHGTRWRRRRARRPHPRRPQRITAPEPPMTHQPQAARYKRAELQDAYAAGFQQGVRPRLLRPARSLLMDTRRDARRRGHRAHGRHARGRRRRPCARSPRRAATTSRRCAASTPQASERHPTVQ